MEAQWKDDADDDDDDDADGVVVVVVVVVGGGGGGGGGGGDDVHLRITQFYNFYFQPNPSRSSNDESFWCFKDWWFKVCLRFVNFLIRFPGS